MCVYTMCVHVCTFLCVFVDVPLCDHEEGFKREVSVCQGPVAASSLTEVKSQGGEMKRARGGLVHRGIHAEGLDRGGLGRADRIFVILMMVEEGGGGQEGGVSGAGKAAGEMVLGSGDGEQG